MKKATAIIGGILAALLVALLAGGVALQSPRVQTRLARKVLARYGDRLGGTITFDEIQLSPFNALILKNVVIVDKEPYMDRPQLAVVDTFARAEYIAATFSLKGLFEKKGLHFNRVSIQDFELNLTIEPGQPDTTASTTNLQRIFRLKDSSETPEDGGDIFDIDKVEVDALTFRMFNFPLDEAFRRRGYLIPDDAIDWNDMEIKGDVRGRNLRLSHMIMSALADEVHIREKSGFEATVSGEVRAGCGMSRIRNLRIDDGRSKLNLREYKMTYKDQKAFNDFIHGVRIQGDIARSVLDMQTIAYFAPALKTNTFRANITGKVDGRVDDLGVEDIVFQDIDSGVSGRINGRVTGLPDVYGMVTDFKVSDFRFTPAGFGRFLSEWAPKVHLDPGAIAKGETLTFNGSGRGPLNRLSVEGSVGSERLGNLRADLDISHLLDPSRDLLMKGHIRTRDLEAGRIIGNDVLGAVTLESGLEAVLAKGNPEVRIDSVRIDRLGVLGYDYTNILAGGTYTNDAFDGRIVCNDPNLNFLFQGLFNLSSTTDNAAYQFYANIGYADLNALNIDKRGKSRVSLRTNANFIYVNKEDLIGEIDVADIVLEDAAGAHKIGNASIQAHSNDDVNRIRFTSGFADGTFLGSKSLLSMVKDIRELAVQKELPSLGTAPVKDRPGSSYSLDFQFHDTGDLLSFIAPGMYIADSTRVSLAVSENGCLDGDVRSRRLAFKDKYLKDVRMRIDNRDSALVGKFSASELRLGNLSVRNNSGTVRAHDDRIALGYTFRNDGENNGELFLDGGLSRGVDGDLVLTARATPSALRFNDQTWHFGSDDIVLHGKDIGISQFRASCDNQTLLVDGGISSERQDTLRVKVDQFDLSMINYLTGKEQLDLRGRATGRAYLISPTAPTPGLLANLICDSTYLASQPVGQVRLASSWSEEKKGFNLLLRNELDGKRNIDLRGFLKPSDRSISLQASLDGLNAAYAAPFLTSVFSETRGRLDGKIRLDGTLDRPAISSEDLAVRDGLLRIGFTNVAYRLNGPVELTPQGAFFRDIALSDGEIGTGTLSGGILYDHFKDLRLDVRTDLKDMHAFDLTPAQNSTFYGNTYGTGKVLVKGPFNNVLLDIDVRTARTGDFHLPLLGAGATKSADLLTFTEPAEETYQDAYEAMMTRLESKSGSATDLDLRLRLQATPAVTAYIEIDKDSGHMLTGRGAGTIELETRTGNGLFTINGDYTLNSGTYKLSVMNLVSREFTIRDGSTIRFNGDVMDSDLDINALYTTRTSMSNLVSDMDVRRTVECGIHISDKLRNPKIGVSIDIPDLDPTYKSYVETALNTEDKLQMQFLYLLLTDNFLPAEESGIANNSSMLYSNVSSIMANQLNNLFEKLDIPLDFGLHYQSNEETSDVFDVALSTQLFNNRVIVNGTIGNRQYTTSGATNELVGDLDVDIKLNRPGTLRLNLFSHSADEYTNFLDNSQRHGGGISWQREFNTFRQFFQDPSGRRRQAEAESGKIILQIDSTGKAHPLPSTHE